MLWHFLEHAIAGLFIASAIAMLVLMFGWLRGAVSIPAVTTILCLGPIGGLIAAIPRRPALFDTAKEIDRQIGANDLISSALLTNRANDFAAAMHAMADARVARVTFASLTLRRFGLRTFVGAGLASTCVVVVTMMLSSPLVERPAIAGTSTNLADRWIDERNVADHARTLSADQPSRPSQRDPHSARPEIADDSRPGTPLGQIEQSGDTRASSSAGSRGSGAASSDATNTRLTDASRATSSSDTGNSASGGGGLATSSGVSGANAGGVVANGETKASIPPWRSAGWSLDRAAALQAVRNGAVPDSYRALVQEYFQRP